jgi:hypothetical protein
VSKKYSDRDDDQQPEPPASDAEPMEDDGEQADDEPDVELHRFS